MKKILTKVGIGLLALTAFAVVVSSKVAWRYPAQGTTTKVHQTAAGVNTWANKTTDTITTDWIPLNDANVDEVGAVTFGFIVPNAAAVGGGGGVGLKDTVHVDIWARSIAGGGVKIADTAYGTPPCTLTVVSTASALIHADAFRISFRTYDTGGTAGGGTNDTLSQTITYAVKVATTRLSVGEGPAQ